MVTSNIKARIPCDIHKVWEFVTSVENYAMKPFVKSYLKKQQAQFISDLKAAVQRV